MKAPDANHGDRSDGRQPRNFFLHLHPQRVTTEALKPTATLGLGLASLALFLVLAATGLLLMLYYPPTTDRAYEAVQDIQHAVPFGGFVRALHRWAAHGMVLAVFLHLLRVFFTGSYFRRRLNWLLGLGLLFSTLGLAFTGYLLPWDQLSFWAVTVSANLLGQVPGIGPWARELLLGGARVSQASLVRFYTLHVSLLPAAVIGLAALHLWRIRRDGGLARTTEAATDLSTVPASPHLLLREATLGLALLSVFCLVALLHPAPLGGPLDYHLPSNPEKTPWYFLWVQEMLSYSAPAGGLVFPGILLAGLILLPFLDREPDGAGRWFGGRRGRRVVLLSTGSALFFLVLFEVLLAAGDREAGGGRAGSGFPPDLLNPATGMLLLAGLHLAVVGTATRSRRAAALAAGTVLLAAVIGFTLIGWSRGPSWSLPRPLEVLRLGLP